MPTKLKMKHYYVNKQYGMFRVGDISKNGILLTIRDTNFDKFVVICRYLEDSVEITKKEYDLASKPQLQVFDYAW